MPKTPRPFAQLLRVCTTRIDGGCLYGSLVKERWEQNATPDRQNRIPIGNYSMLIDHPAGWILVNAGPGDKAPTDFDTLPTRSRSSLLRFLRDLGLTPKDISTVVLTHLYSEYAGGGTHMTSSGRVLPTFSNARYIVQRAAFEEACHPSERSAHLYRSDDFLPIEETGQLELVEGPAVVADGVSVTPAPGPTAGHQMVVAESGTNSFAFIGSLVPTTMHLEPTVTSSADWSPEDTMRTKRAVMDRAVTERWVVAPVGVDAWVRAEELPALTCPASASRMAPVETQKLVAMAS